MKILLATNGSPSSDSATDLICATAEKSSHVITVVGVSIPEYLLPGPWDRVLERDAEAQRAVEKARKRLSDGGFGTTTKVLHGLPGSEIVREAEEGRFELVVLGWDGVSADLIGPISFYILDHCRCPVLVVREAPTHAPARVLLATDGSRSSEAALESAGRLFNRLLVRIRVTTVAEAVDRVPVGAGIGQWGAGPLSQSAETHARLNSTDAARHFRLRGFSVEEVVGFGDPAEELVRELNEGLYDVVVVGARRDKPGVYHMLGHVAEAVLRRAPATLIARHRSPSSDT